MFDTLDVHIEAKEVLMGMRRLGEKHGKQHFFLLLNDNEIAICCWRGHHDFPEKWKNVELTRKECYMESDMFKKAAESNLKQSNDEVAKNLVWKVMGRRGARILRQNELQHDKEINEEGRVVLQRDKNSQGHPAKQPRSPQTSHSPPYRPTRRRLITTPRRFGQTD